MSEKNPKKLDELFQHGSEQYDFEYNPEAWEQMESLMDKDKRRRRIWWWWGGMLFLLLGGSIWWFTTKEIKHAPSQITIEETAGIKGQNELKNTEATSPDKNVPPNLSIQSPVDTGNTKNHADPRPAKSDNKAFQKLPEEIDTDPAKEKPKAIKENAIQPARPIAAGKEILIIKETTSKTEGDQNVAVGDSIKKLNRIAMVESTALAQLPVLPFSTLSYKNENFKTPELPATMFKEKGEALKAGRQNFLLLGILVAGEMNVVDTDHPTGLDWKGGIQVEYFYQGRYSISLGANYVQKSYLAGAGAYSPPEGFWTRKIAPQSTEGMCKILETPLLIGYYPRGILRPGLFAKIGITSFFLLKERYYFSYDLPDADLVYKWYGKNEYRHWFGIGQMSMGYNWGLGSKMSLQVAPYFQIPLTGLGHGKVKLWSIGVNANFNFRIN